MFLTVLPLYTEPHVRRYLSLWYWPRNTELGLSMVIHPDAVLIRGIPYSWKNTRKKLLNSIEGTVRSKLSEDTTGKAIEKCPEEMNGDNQKTLLQVTAKVLYRQKSMVKLKEFLCRINF